MGIGKAYLMNLLITPVQRIPRYEMLLKQLIKYTPKEHPDSKNINKAYTSVLSVADFLNEGKKQDLTLHKFERKTSSRPTTCDYCNTSIWGIARASFVCAKCGWVAHTKCVQGHEKAMECNVSGPKRKDSLIIVNRLE